MKVKLKDLKPNPFKKWINNGKLNREAVDRCKESIAHGTLPNRFTARKTDRDYELVYGHHRLQAFRETKGKELQVNIDVVTYTDEQMLIDMIRENITQKHTDFQDTEDSILLTRKWLECGVSTINQFDKTLSKRGRPLVSKSYSDIAKFLSKKGKAIEAITVRNHLDIYDKLDKTIHDKVKKLRGGQDIDEDDVSFKQALALAKLPKKEQKPMLKALKRSRMQLGWKQRELVSKYQLAPNEIKEKVLTGKIDIVEVPELLRIEEMKQFLQKREVNNLEKRDRVIRAQEIVSLLRMDCHEIIDRIEKLNQKLIVIDQKGIEWFDRKSLNSFDTMIDQTMMAAEDLIEKCEKVR